MLLALSAWWTYRGRYAAIVPVIAAAGAILLALSIAWPTALARPYKLWMSLAEALAFVSSRIILAIVFVFVVTPLGFIMRFTRWDPLQRRAAPRESYWVPYSERQRDRRHYERMF